MPLVKPPELCESKIDSAEDGLSEEGIKVARTVPPESILVSCIGNLGKIGFNTVEVAFNQQINAILPNYRKAIPEFTFYQAISDLNHPLIPVTQTTRRIGWPVRPLWRKPP